MYRIDRDTTRSNRQLNEQLQQINRGEPCVLVGTQMLAKGHHFPNVTLVAVVNADAGLLSPDFRAPERTAQLIVQVAGRAGRAERPGEVWIQSYQPDNPCSPPHRVWLPGLCRYRTGEPPTGAIAAITPMALVRAESEDAALAQRFATVQSTVSKPRVIGTGRNNGARAGSLGRLANRHRFQLMLVGQDRRSLHRCLSASIAAKHQVSCVGY